MAALFLALLELAEAAVTLAEGAAGAEAVAVEMGAVTEASSLLAPLAADAETAEVTYGSIRATGAAAAAYQNASQAYAAGAMVASATATAAERIYDSAMKSYENRKRRRDSEASKARKRLRFDSLDIKHIQRCIKPGKAEGLVGFPNTYTSTMHAFRPVVTT